MQNQTQLSSSSLCHGFWGKDYFNLFLISNRISLDMLWWNCSQKVYRTPQRCSPSFQFKHAIFFWCWHKSFPSTKESFPEEVIIFAYTLEVIHLIDHRLSSKVGNQCQINPEFQFSISQLFLFRITNRNWGPLKNRRKWMNKTNKLNKKYDI